MSRRLVLLSASFLQLISGLSEVQAQTPSSDEIIRKLTPPPLIRSIRGITVTPGQEAAKPTIDLYINFEFDSAKLIGESILVLQRLGTALSDPKLTDYHFEVAGHTDAVGTIEYNQTLSLERANAVVDYLIVNYRIPRDRLTAIGYGKSRLLDSSRPDDGVNRRVQITNVGL
jgi:outer membrane protein OmpA-like peptidoglycan-associated protein